MKHRVRVRRSLFALSVLMLSLATGSRAQVASSVLTGTNGTVFAGIGDLAGGGVGSAVRDATRAGGTIYAVGASTISSPGTPVPSLDTPALWTWPGSGSGTLSALPTGVTLTTHPGNAISAYAITKFATFIASQAHYTDGSSTSNWVRVDVSQLPAGGNLNLSTASGTGAFAALAISDSGDTVYGQRTDGAANVATRYQEGVGFNQPPLPPGTAWSYPVPRGTSDNGLVMVGVASPVDFTGTGTGVFPIATNTTAFRYVHDAGNVTGTTTVIPPLVMGGWNFPIAVSADGNVTLVAGNSAAVPNGEIYLYNTPVSGPVTTTALGSPNTAWTPRLLGGMTADGSVVAVTFANSPIGGGGGISGLGLLTGPNTKYAYVHNSHGWFHLSSALAAQGIDLTQHGWDPTNMAVTGVRTVDGVDLVVGQGRRRTVGAGGFIDGAVEGFVAQFPAGYLASFGVTPVAPTDRSIVGAWGLGPDPNVATLMYVFRNDGTYFQIGAGGFERGAYSWAGAGGAYYIWTTRDTDGVGISNFNGKLGRTLSISGDTITITDTNCATCAATTLTRVTPQAGSLVGGWVTSDATVTNSRMLVLTGSASGGKYFFAQDSGASNDRGEVGTWAWSAGSTQLALSAITVNSNGQQQGTADKSQLAHLTRAELGLIVDDAGTTFDYTRVVNPAAVQPVITNATLTASGNDRGAFGGYTVTATYGLTFSALGLPPGLAIDSATGQITGTPTSIGTFNVTITATNAFGATDTRTLVITIGPGPVSFLGIGDLPEGPGGVGSAVRDATRVGGALYAVGASTTTSVVTPLPNLDTPVIWTWSAGPTGTLTSLPAGSSFPAGLLPGAPADSITAWAITSPATFIASQAHNSPLGNNGTSWARVTVSGLTNTLLGGATPTFVALSLSDDPYSVVYGQSSTNPRLVVRYDNGTVTLPSFASEVGLDAALAFATPTPRATSADGLVMVGVASQGTTASNGFFAGTNGHAFRYVHGTGTTAIPMLTGGSWNFPIAVSAGGDVTLVAGNSTAVPSGEIYLYNTPVGGPVTTTALGSPNTALTPRLLGGMTADGAVVAVTFANSATSGIGQIAGLVLPTSNRGGYLHNSHGWFTLGHALYMSPQAINLSAAGWSLDDLAITGIRTVGGVDLVFGQGTHNGNMEGFVAEFPAGFLAAFDPAANLPLVTNTTLSLTAATGSTISYTVTGTHATTFGATGLPAGLSIDASTGVISGTTTVIGTLQVTITASNALGDVNSKTLVLNLTGPARFYQMGDLAGGGIASSVRDATRVSGTVYAVGSGTARVQVVCTNPPINTIPAGCVANSPPLYNLDSPALWSWAGLGPLTATLLPEGSPVNHTTETIPVVNQISAYAINPLATFIASQAHFTQDSTANSAVRVERGLLPSTTANRNLGAAGSPALSLSDDGVVVYTTQSNGSRRAVVGTSVTVSMITGVGGETLSFPTPRGTSWDGSVMVGTSWASGSYTGTNGHAFRYVQATGTSAIPTLSGGGWNFPIAVSSDGTVTLVAGNSPMAPRGEIYLYNTPAVGPATTTLLGSPNTAWFPRLLGGMTADGVVAVTFANDPAAGTGGATTGIPSGAATKYAYVHNSHGWFHLSSALAAQGIDLSGMGWDPTNLAITSIRTIEGVDLVSGQGRRRGVVGTGYVDGAVEGFVAEFPAGYLAAYADPTPTPPTNKAIVGAWALGSDPANPAANFVLSFMNDGTYYQVSNGGFERGVYSWAGDGSYRLWTKQADGAGGGAASNGRLGRSIAITGGSANTLTITDAYCPGCSVAAGTFTRITGATSTLLGGWIVGDPTTDNGSAMLVLTGAAGATTGKYFLAQAFGDPDDHTEIGTWTWNSTNPTTLSWSAITTIKNGVTGAGTASVDPAHMTADELGLVIGTAPDIFSLRRILDPASVPPVITNATLTASGSAGATFGGYTVTATHGLTYSALGLPPGLTIDSTTGQITGTPTQTGTFNVTITATNTLGTTDSRTLVITVALGATTFQGIGDLTGGGVGSAVRDATRVGGTIYAVGASTISNNTLPVPNLDTPALWKRPGGGIGTLSALPTGVTLITHPGNSISAYAITPFAEYIASQAHYTDGSNTSNWVRVDVSQLPASGNLNLSTASGTGAFAALAISDNGATVYGQRTDGAANVATRYQSGVGGGFNQPPLPAGTAWSFPVPRGTSADGLVMVGVASPAAFGGTGGGVFPMATNTTAFRYVHNAGTLTGTTTAIPPLVTGGWNFPIAVSADGNVTLVAGNSPLAPNGEIYLYNTPVSGPATTTSLGSPNTAWTPRLLGGMTSDGSVVAVTFANSPNGGPAGISGLGLPTGPNQKYAYLHNNHGWFHLSSALAAQGIDLAAQGWDPTNLLVTGIRTVENVDLVFGQGRRRTVGVTNVPTLGAVGYIDGEVEGFVAEFPAGYLATIATTPTPPADPSIVGAWGLGADANAASLMYVYMNDGTYFQIGNGGFERGVYTLGADGTYRIWTTQDADGAGISNFNGKIGRMLSISGDTITITDVNCPGCTPTTLTRVVPQAGSLVGGWLLGDATIDNGSAMLVLTGTAGGGKYFFAQDLDGPDDHSEVGTWTQLAGSLALSGITGNLNGQQQVVPDSSQPAHLTGDELGLVVDDAGMPLNFTRVVNPATVVPVITSPLTADGVVGESFSYPIVAFRGVTFDATSLPGWLSINTATGLLSGTPPAAATESLTIYASNSIGGTGSAPLAITTRNHQAPLVVLAQASAAFAVTFTVDTSGGNGTGDVTFTTSGGCTNTGGGADVTMTSGTVACSITATKAADGSFTQAISDAILVSAEKRAASVTPNPAAKDFGAGDPVLSGTLNGFLHADNVAATYSRTSGETVAGSPYTISATLSTTGDLTNYEITYNTAAFSINAAAQATLTVQVPQSTAVYGSTFSVTPSGGSGVGVVTYAASGACTNAGGGADITMVSGTGTCIISATKASDGSYAPAVSAPVEVTAVALAASVAPNPAFKVVGGVDPALSGTLSGFLAGDNVAAIYARATGEAEGPYTISATLAPAGVLSNYDITYNTAVFTINPPAPSVQVLSPNGGERVFVGVPVTITWAATGATVSFDVELSRNNGTSYTSIAGCVGLPAGTTSCIWTPTTPASTTALVRVTAHPAGGPVSDSSDAVFTIVNAAPSVTVTAPNAAVSWTVGTTQSITWNHNLGTLAPVKIELSRDNGATWETLSESTPSTTATTGSFSWLVTAPAVTSSALVRVTWLNGSASDVSNVAFTIASPAVAVTAPNTLVTWRAGTVHNITFTHNLGVGQLFNISVSRDSGASWTPVGTFTTTSATSGSYSWIVDGPATTGARVRVAAAGGGGVTDDSDTDFGISSRIVVTSPNTALTWAAGTVRTITWTHNLLASDTVDIFFSPDGGATWQPVASSVPNSSATNGSYTGALPATQTGQGLIRVSWTGHPAEFDVSDVAFTLVAPTVTVTAPNTNVAWVIGSHHNITWTHNLGTGESVHLEVSRNGGATWSDVAASVLNSGAASGTFDWLVDGPVTTAARIRASWANGGATQDISDVDFSVTSAITVTAPNTAVTWAADTTRTITWNHSLGAAAAFDVALSPDNGASWLPVAAGVPAATATTGSFTGVLPAVQSTQALVRVSPAGLPTSGDISNVVFTLAAPGVAITAPNTALSWVVGTHHNITWTHNLGTGESVRLDVSRDGGATWTQIAAGVANSAATSGVFDWLVDAPLTSTARVRATWTRNGTVQDANDVNFSVASAINVTAPNTAVTWAAGSTRTITWNHSLGAAATFDIDFSPDNGVTWTSVATGVPAATATTGTLTAPMPVVAATTQALVRVSPAGSPLIGDASNVTFTLAAPLITVTAPNTNVSWTVGSLRNITWSHNLGTADAVKIELSRNGGAAWTVLAASVTNTAATTGTFAWTVTTPATTAALIRITWVNNAGVTDVSNVNFKIQ